MEFDVKVTGFDELAAKLKRLGERAYTVMGEAIDETTIEIMGKAQRNIKANYSQSTGALFNSVRVTSARKLGQLVKGSVVVNSSYGYYVEYGRRAGKMPPVDNILQWVRKKGLLDTYSIATKKIVKRSAKLVQQQQSVAFAIAKSIGKKGTKAKPFLRPAFVAKRNRYIIIANSKVNKLLNEAR